MTSDRRRPFVLVADDDRDTRELYRACLDTSGYRTAEASNGSEAIVCAVEAVPDLLLTDYVMPDVDGLTIARRLKADPRTSGIHILLVTGYAAHDLERRASAAGIARVFFKPCLPQAVIREVSRAIARPVLARPRRARPLEAVPATSGGDGAAIVRVRDEFAALPGLTLTAEQARLVFDLERDRCHEVLRTLVAEGFLAETPRGKYTRPRVGSQ